MKVRTVFIIALVLLLSACGRSKDPTLYLLTPLHTGKNSTAWTNMTIGIEDIHIPYFLEKKDLIINTTQHQLMLQPYSEWAEPLSRNIPRILRTNLSNILSGAVVKNAPWDSKFKPEIQLEVYITQMTMHLNGESTLNAEYLIYRQGDLVRKKTVQYQNKVVPVTTESRVISMNNNISQLSRDIAMSIKRG